MPARTSQAKASIWRKRPRSSVFWEQRAPDVILPQVLLDLNLAFELVRQRDRLARGGSRSSACEQRRKQRGREVHLPDVGGWVD